ncbi:hypothetical protein BOQ63_015270 [Streptomyces viridifaciens]|nr:hypothetical protein BOQ63_015270 [Streptomyces viridifaciens]
MGLAIPLRGGTYHGTNGARLPMEFLLAVTAAAEPGSASARMAAEQTRGIAGDPQSGSVLEALLTKPFRAEAPG